MDVEVLVQQIHGAVHLRKRVLAGHHVLLQTGSLALIVEGGLLRQLPALLADS